MVPTEYLSATLATAYTVGVLYVALEPVAATKLLLIAASLYANVTLTGVLKRRADAALDAVLSGQDGDEEHDARDGEGSERGEGELAGLGRGWRRHGALPPVRPTTSYSPFVVSVTVTVCAFPFEKNHPCRPSKGAVKVPRSLASVASLWLTKLSVPSS